MNEKFKDGLVYEEDFKLLDKKLNKKKFKVIGIMHDNPTITIKALADKANMTEKQIVDLIDQLEVFDVAFSVGGGRFFMLTAKGYLYLLHGEEKFK